MERFIFYLSSHINANSYKESQKLSNAYEDYKVKEDFCKMVSLVNRSSRAASRDDDCVTTVSSTASATRYDLGQSISHVAQVCEIALARPYSDVFTSVLSFRKRLIFASS